VFLLILVILGSHFYGIQDTLKMVLAMCFRIFLHLCVYYVILGLLLPLFRRHISARACAMLWLIPNYLYITEMSYMELPEPLLVIHASSRVVSILFALWIVGFLSVFLWKIGEHLVFRRKILRNAKPVTDKRILEIFQKQIEDAGMVKPKPKFKLITSPDAVTPLTIGLFKRSTRVILPTNTYTDEELKLIFRHELIHIGREDSWSKFFMMFCTAMCWFNPLMWIAMKKSAEDTELSCDETVLLDADDDTRKKYANLILKTAGNDRGFTTCLSASASSMRYRLKSIVSPGKKHSGALIVGLMFFILCMTSGYVALAYGEETGAETVFRNYELSSFVADDITVSGGQYDSKLDNIDAEALTAYIAGLQTQEMTGNYSFSKDDREVSIWYDTPYGVVLLDLHSNHVRVFYLSDEEDRSYIYHLPDGTDWEYVDSIVPPLPVAEVILSDGTQYGGSDLTATVTKLSITNDNVTTVLKDRVLGPHEGSGIFGSLDYESATINFSMPLVSPAELLIESWDYKTSYTITQTDLGNAFAFEMPDFPAHFTLTATFQGENGVYETTFFFNVGDMNSN
ncbi:MAG: M48 family metalloprotease, partial [Bacteroidales bacterium]|nr:M48 family metalloprotease [Bacteroidales bacterium]